MPQVVVCRVRELVRERNALLRQVTAFGADDVLQERLLDRGGPGLGLRLELVAVTLLLLGGGEAHGGNVTMVQGRFGPWRRPKFCNDIKTPPERFRPGIRPVSSFSYGRQTLCNAEQCS